MENSERNIRSFGDQLDFRAIRTENLDAFRRFHPQNIAVVGMGGSGLPGSILHSARETIGLKAPVFVWKDYNLPKVTGETLFLFISFSGETEETISGLRLLIKKKAPHGSMAVVTSGGTLEKIARAHKIPLATFSRGTLTPRQATGIMFYAAVKLLRAAGFTLRFPHVNIRPLTLRSKGGKLAKKLRGKIVLVYTDEALKTLGYIWKIQLNETAKALAFSNVLPELDHNELVSFEKRTFPRAAIFLEDPSANHQFKKRVALTQALLKQRGVPVHAITPMGRNYFEKVWNMIVLGEWAAYFLAKQSNINPEETKIIEKLKAGLKKDR